jgi:hypothetical protein
MKNLSVEVFNNVVWHIQFGGVRNNFVEIYFKELDIPAIRKRKMVSNTLRKKRVRYIHE